MLTLGTVALIFAMILSLIFFYMGQIFSYLIYDKFTSNKFKKVVSEKKFVRVSGIVILALLWLLFSTPWNGV